MKTKTSYMVKFENGTSVWFTPGRAIPEKEVVSKEERPMLYADEGKLLRNKNTQEVCECIWLKDTTEQDWEEIEKEQEESEEK